MNPGILTAAEWAAASTSPAMQRAAADQLRHFAAKRAKERAYAGTSPSGQPLWAQRDAIEREARRAAHGGATWQDACPYPAGTEAEALFTALFVRAGGRVTTGATRP